MYRTAVQLAVTLPTAQYVNHIAQLADLKRRYILEEWINYVRQLDPLLPAIRVTFLVAKSETQTLLPGIYPSQLASSQ